jgi:hypothetical protein
VRLRRMRTTGRSGAGTDSVTRRSKDAYPSRPRTLCYLVLGVFAGRGFGPDGAG